MNDQQNGAEGAVPVSRWGAALSSLALTLVVTALATGLAAGGALLYARLAGTGEAGVHAPGGIETLAAKGLALHLILFQAASITLTVVAVQLLRRTGLSFLPLHWPRRGLAVIAASVLGLLVLASVGGAIVYHFDRPAFETDMRPFADLARTRAMWLLFAAAALGAPLAEELLFRGLLFTGLRASPLGFAGAALISSVLWTAMHANYSPYGLALVFSIGLFLAVIREKTGSLVPSMAAHAVYNGLIVLALAFAPQEALGAG